MGCKHACTCGGICKREVNLLKIIRYGASIHPGNPLYAVLVLACFIVTVQNNEVPWYAGFVSIAIWVSLYIGTSYLVGKANWDYKTRSPRK